MKIAIAIAIATALGSIGILAVQTVMALDVGPGASSFAPGQKFSPNDPYRANQFAPGTEFRSVPPNPVIPGASSFSPGLQALAAGGGSGGPG